MRGGPTRKSRFTVEQLIQIQRKDQGSGVLETVRRHGISEKTYYTWKAKYGNLGLTEARRLKLIRTRFPEAAGLSL